MSGKAEQVPKAAGRLSAYDIVRLCVPTLVTLAALALHEVLPNIYPEGYESHAYPAALIALLCLWIVLDLVSIPSRQLRAVMIKDSWLFGALVCFFALWDWATLKTGMLELPLMTSPDAVFEVLVNENTAMLLYLGQSCQLLFIGLFFGALFGLISGLLMGWFKAVDYWMSPIVWIFGPMPGAVMLPIVVLIMPNSYSTAACIVALAMWFALTFNLAEAVKNVDKRVIEAARVTGAGTPRVIFHVVLPMCLPSIFSGLFMGTCFSFTSLLTAEMLSASGGLGGYMVWSKSNVQFADIYAAMLVVIVFFFLVLEILTRVQAYMLRWKENPVEW